MKNDIKNSKITYGFSVDLTKRISLSPYMEVTENSVRLPRKTFTVHILR